MTRLLANQQTKYASMLCIGHIEAKFCSLTVFCLLFDRKVTKNLILPQCAHCMKDMVRPDLLA